MRVKVFPEDVFMSLGLSAVMIARLTIWIQLLTLRRMRMWRFVFAALMW